MKVKYSSNNSGGSWWLSKDDWLALEEAGWVVEWRDWLDSPAKKASREGLTLSEAIKEFDSVTSANSTDLGCSCCGTPHSFSFEGDNGETEYYSPDYPEQGAPYGADS